MTTIIATLPGPLGESTVEVPVPDGSSVELSGPTDRPAQPWVETFPVADLAALRLRRPQVVGTLTEEAGGDERERLVAVCDRDTISVRGPDGGVVWAIGLEGVKTLTLARDVQ